jgi:hypothetical protein
MFHVHPSSKIEMANITLEILPALVNLNRFGAGSVDI